MIFGMVNAQTSPTAKNITYSNQTWFSFNSTMRFSEQWGMVADFHIRRDDFLRNDYFYFLRAGGVYWIDGKFPVIAGLAHTWLAPPAGGTTWSNENRIYQQWSGVFEQRKVSVLNRIRVEERWKDIIVNDELTGDKQFSVRLRYLISFEKRFSENRQKPSLIISDEVLVQFGKEIILNTFDQNRLFIGAKVPLNERLSCDFGYMNIIQQKATGYQYDVSNVFRLFFYYNIDLAQPKHAIQLQDATE